MRRRHSGGVVGNKTAGRRETAALWLGLSRSGPVVFERKRAEWTFPRRRTRYRLSTRWQALAIMLCSWVMTLIINAATQRFIVHASDRLLTKRVGDKFHVHSDTENKSLVVVTKDAICVIGYTGAAYVGDVITDGWIASTITQLDVTGQFMTRTPGIRGLRLNTLLWRLKTATSKLILPGSSNYLGISISGIRQRNRYVRPFIREIERNRGVVRCGGYMRDPRSPGFHGLSQLGDRMTMAELHQFIGDEFVRYGISAEAFRCGMINAIRERATVSKVIGDEIVTVTISRSLDCWDVVWTFESPNPRQAAVVDASGRLRGVFNSYFSPWIISPMGITKPSFGNGHLEHLIGDVKIRCGNKVEQEPGQGLLLAVSSQERTPHH